jgi:hypothetical protein
MRISIGACLISVVLCAPAGSPQAATLLDDSYVASASAAALAISESEFNVDTPGLYRLTLTDLQTPAVLDSVRAVVTRGATVVARADATGSVEFNATAGVHKLRVLADAPAYGSLGAAVAAAAGGTVVLEVVYPVAPEVQANLAESLLQERIAIDLPGSYQLQFADTAFPAALASWDILLLAPDLSVAARLCSPAQPPVCTDATTAAFTAVAGEYELLIDAAAAGILEAGLYRVGLHGAATAYAATVPVGRMPAARTFDVPSAGSLQLNATDRQFPQALTNLHVALAQGDAAPALLATAGTSSFQATAGEARLFVLPVVAAQSGAGSFSVQVAQGSEVLHAITRMEPESGFIEVALPAAGAHTLTVSDFDFPAPLARSYVVLGQGGALLDTLTGNGSAAFSAQAGTARLSYSAVASAGGGVVGFELESPAGDPLLQASRGVGDLLNATTLAITTGGSYDLALSDLQFPESLATLAIAVTRGTQSVAQIYGGGRVSFAATPGEYSLNFVAAASASARQGLYGIEVSNTPAPTVTLQAGSTSVSTQQSVTLTWSSTGATSCAAGGGWSGALSTSGSAQAGPFTADTSLSVSCTGPGGSATQTVAIDVTAPDSGGGGATGPWSLVVLAALGCLRVGQGRRRSG